MEWTESIDIGRPVEQVRAAVADEHALMRWSAWPQATGFTCVVEGDGRSPGSTRASRWRPCSTPSALRKTIAEPGRVEYRLRNRGPRGREMTPEIDFRFEPIDASATRVHLDFRATVPLPPGARHLVDLLLGRRVRRLHVVDLQQLKAHVESRPVVRGS